MQGLRFVVGTYEQRWFSGPAIRGEGGSDERDGGALRGRFPLKKLPDGGLRLSVPGADVVTLSKEAARALGASGRVSLLVAWPAVLCVVRVNRVVTFAEGDLFRFGDLALDSQRVLRQTGFQYLADSGAEVEVELELEERSSLDPDRAMKRLGFDSGARAAEAALQPTAPRQASLDTVKLAPAQTTRFGPYELTNERSFDHSRRPAAGVAVRGYFFRLRRLGEEPMEPRDSSLPDPFGLRSAEELVALVRSRGLLGEDEALLGEKAPMLDLVARFEGPAALLERELDDLGPHPVLRFVGDVLTVTAPRVFRSATGSPALGRATIMLPPVGPPRLTREDADRTLPGRLLKR